jgi:hypothetical protein
MNFARGIINVTCGMLIRALGRAEPICGMEDVLHVWVGGSSMRFDHL